MADIHMKRHPELELLIAGDYMMDRYLYCDVSRVSPEAPVPVAKVRSVEHRVGGAGNVALNVIALGSGVKALTCVGTDAAGDDLLAGLKAAGIDVTHVHRSPVWTTSLKTRIVAQNQQLLRYDEEEPEAAMGQEESFLSYLRQYTEEIFAGVRGVVLSDYGKGVLTHETAQLLIDESRKRGLPVFIDPKGADWSKYRGATVCTPNLKELTEASGMTRLAGEEDISWAARAICERVQLDHLLVTRSEKGMSLISRGIDGKQDFPAAAKEVSDVTGAGDTVISVIAVCMTAGEPLDVCCRLANAAASVVVSKFGAETASVEEINAALLDDRQSVPGQKICSWEQIASVARHLHAEGRRIVFTNGCFDLVHAGHIASFRQARSFGDVLVVGVNSDESIRRLKGPSRPIVGLRDRMKLLEALEMVDYIVPFSEDTPQKLIETVRPDVLVKGKDWEGKTVAGAGFIQAYGGTVMFADLEQGLSTTALVEKIRAGV